MDPDCKVINNCIATTILIRAAAATVVGRLPVRTTYTPPLPIMAPMNKRTRRPLARYPQEVACQELQPPRRHNVERNGLVNPRLHPGHQFFRITYSSQ